MKKLESTWLAKTNGERYLGGGPSGAELLDRGEERQQQLMQTFINNIESLEDEENDADIGPLLDRKRSHRPDKPVTLRDTSSSDDNALPPPHSAPKLSQARCRSTSTKTFKKVRIFT